MTSRPVFRSGGAEVPPIPEAKAIPVDGFLTGQTRTDVFYGSEWADTSTDYLDEALMHHWLMARGEAYDAIPVMDVAVSVLDNLHRGGFDPMHVDMSEPGDIVALAQFMAALRISRTSYQIVRTS